MDYKYVIECHRRIIDSIYNCYLPEEILSLTPRNIKTTVDSWVKDERYKQHVEELVVEWLKFYEANHASDFEIKVKDTHCTVEEKHEILRKTLVSIEKSLDTYLSGVSNGTRICKGCDLEEIKERIKTLLEGIHSLNGNKKTRFLNALKSTGYNYIDDLNYYGFLSVFIYEIINLELYIYCEIVPNKDTLFHLDKVFPYDTNLCDELKDRALIKRLEFYRTIGERNKNKYLVSKNSNKWNINFQDFAKLYRAILGLSNKAIPDPSS